MKANPFFRLLAALGALWALNLGAIVPPGDHAGNGGDPLAGEFVARGYFVLYTLETRHDMALLSPEEIQQFKLALRDTRIEFVDHPLFDNEGKQVSSVVTPDPTDSSHKLIQLNKNDWLLSMMHHLDLVRLVFHEYLRAIEKFDDNYVVSSQLTVTEDDFQKRPMGSPDCLSNRFESVSIDLNIKLSYPYVRSPAYVNGVDFAPSDRTSFRVFRSPRLCTANAYPFKVELGDFTKTLSLHGGDSVALFVPENTDPPHVTTIPSAAPSDAGNAGEIQQRLQWWEQNHPEFTPRP